MRVLVCGGHRSKDRDRVFDVLDGLHRIHGFTEVIEGGADGVDRFARLWALRKDVPCTTCLADWKRYRRAAGPIRNRQMLGLKPDLVVAFPGQKGTANMVGQAHAAGVQVVEVGEGEGTNG